MVTKLATCGCGKGWNGTCRRHKTEVKQAGRKIGNVPSVTNRVMAMI